jgi:hypothetical protein
MHSKRGSLFKLVALIIGQQFWRFCGCLSTHFLRPSSHSALIVGLGAGSLNFAASLLPYCRLRMGKKGWARKKSIEKSIFAQTTSPFLKGKFLEPV